MIFPSIGFHYNCDIRDNGTPRRMWDAYCRHQGRENGGVKYRRPTPAEEMTEHDFHLFIDDGRDDIPMDLPGPNAAWMVDTHLGYDTRKNWAEKFDIVYCAQQDGAEEMSKSGINAHWLPLACHPNVDPSFGELRTSPAYHSITGTAGLRQEYDVVFVGFLNDGADGVGNNRVDYLDTVFGAVDSFWYNTNCFFQEAAIRYLRGRTGFNISIKNDLNMRFFEVMSYGTCLVTNRDVIGWKELGFEEGVHFVGYEGEDEAVGAVQWCLDNPMQRELIARTGHRKVRAEHTYAHRLARICEDMSRSNAQIVDNSGDTLQRSNNNGVDSEVDESWRDVGVEVAASEESEEGVVG